MSKISENALNTIIKNELPWAFEAGIQVTKVESGKAWMTLPYQTKSLRPGGSIAGPHMMMLADACMYAVVLSLVGEVKLAV
ncbi:MAG: acyl-coenzyme A thioesterase PaaI-like protein, partial [Gammaproteobacteria bacterium]